FIINWLRVLQMLLAQFITVCSAYILAVELRIGSLFSSRWHTNRGASWRCTPIPKDQFQPTTKSDKLSDAPYNTMRPLWFVSYHVKLQPLSLLLTIILEALPNLATPTKC